MNQSPVATSPVGDDGAFDATLTLVGTPFTSSRLDLAGRPDGGRLWLCVFSIGSSGGRVGAAATVRVRLAARSTSPGLVALRSSRILDGRAPGEDVVIIPEGTTSPRGNRRASAPRSAPTVSRR